MVKYGESIFLHFQQTLMGILKWDKNFVITDMNGAAEKIFGYTREEAIGQNSLDIIIPESARGQIERVWNNLVTSKKPNININENTTKYGRHIICKWFNTPLIDEAGTVIAVASMVQDITEQKRVEKELIEAREKLEARVKERTYELTNVNKKLKNTIKENKRIKSELQKISERNAAILQAMPDIIFVLSKEGTYIDIKAAKEETLTIPPSELIGKNIRDINFSEYDQGAILNCIEKTLLTGKEQSIQYELNTPAGLCVYQATLVPLNKNEIVATVRDITEWKNSEQKKEILMKELKSSREASDNANKAKSSFLANMSHELRTPLNAILGFGQLLEIGQDNLTRQQIEFLEHIKHSSNHLLEMVNDILDLSKIEAGKYEIEKKTFNLGQMLARLPMSVNSLAFKKNIEFIVDIKLENEIIEADEVRLKQVLYNLLSNAIKFTDTGKKIGIKARTGEGEAVIEVWDEGRGLSKEEMGKIFDPFEQVGKFNRKGTGLGLTISRKLIELHGGRLSVKSKQGEGSHFTINLPGIIAHSGKEIIQRKVELPFKKQLTRGGINILVVEDDLIHQKIIEETLKYLGYHAHCVRSGVKGIEAAINEKYDLILMDIHMPELSGIETMKEIKKYVKEEIPIVAITAYAMKGDMEKFKAAGFDGYVPKPVMIKKLKETIENLLERKNFITH